jgi:hypothetical protein
MGLEQVELVEGVDGQLRAVITLQNGAELLISSGGDGELVIKWEGTQSAQLLKFHQEYGIDVENNIGELIVLIGM